MVFQIMIIASAPVEKYDFYIDYVKESDICICADGGANTAKEMEISPDYIIGDLDSIKPEILKFYKDKSKIIKDENQNKTDFELALELAESLNPKKIIIIGAIGKRIDHTLANIFSISKINKNIRIIIVDHNNSLEIIEKDSDIIGSKDDLVSIVPLTKIKNLNYKGFKWNVNNLDTNFGWFGISNRLDNKKANISLSKGKLLLIRVNKQ